MCETHEDGKKFVVNFVLMVLANVLLVAGLVGVFVNLSGCNTVKGAMKDGYELTVKMQEWVAGDDADDYNYNLASGD